MKRALRGNNATQPTKSVAAEGRLAKVAEMPFFRVGSRPRQTYLTLLVAGISMRTTLDLGALGELQNMADIVNAAVEEKIQQAFNARDREAEERFNRVNREIGIQAIRLAEALSRDPFSGAVDT